MRLLFYLQSLVKNFRFRNRQEVQLDDELRAYINLSADERLAAGMTDANARRAALLELGGIEQVKEAVRDQRSGVGLELLWQDLRYAWRQLKRNLGYTTTVLLTLALSIGVNTAIFSIVNALMLKSLPYSHPERMGSIYTRYIGVSSSDERHHIDGEQWELLRDNVPALISAIASTRTSGVNLQSASQARYLNAARVSAHYFQVLSIGPLLGRTFTEAEDRPNGPKAAILNYELWRADFGADTHIIGQTIYLKGDPYTVIGVLPESTVTPLNADLYTAIQASRNGEGGGTNFQVITRLRDSFTWRQADAQINRAWATRPHPYELALNPGAKVSYHSVSLQQGETAPVRPPALALMFAAATILLIACANLAGLSLVRLLRRSVEVTTRLALGASNWQIQRQLWTEVLLLALLGGAAGVVTGFAVLHGLLALLPEHFLPVSDISLDSHVLLFALVISLLASLLAGIAPALSLSRMNLRPSSASRTVTGSDRLGLRQLLIMCEVALTVVLLAGSGLLIRSLIHLQTLPIGFDPSNVITARASLDDARYHDAAAFRKLLNQSVAAMRQIPGVKHAAVGLSLPFERALVEGGITIDDGKEAGRDALADIVYVTPDYFAALRIPLLAGRAFSTGDSPAAQQVTIVNRSFMLKFLSGGNAVGRHLDKGMLIVGLAEDVKVSPGASDSSAPITDEPTLYMPAAQMGSRQLSLVHIWFQPSWIVRTNQPIPGLAIQMQRALAGVDPGLPFSGVYRMRDLLARTLSRQRVEVALLGSLAALALLLSAIGIFGLIANIVAQRTREIGIRLALGSTVRAAVLQIGRPGIQACALGILAGAILCAGALPVMRSVLYGIGVYDPLTIFCVLLTLLAVALSAAILPALRVAGIDPAQTLRHE